MTNKKPVILKETEEERKERIRLHNCTRTKVIKSKKLYDRNKIKKENIE